MVQVWPRDSATCGALIDIPVSGLRCPASGMASAKDHRDPGTLCSACHRAAPFLYCLRVLHLVHGSISAPSSTGSDVARAPMSHSRKMKATSSWLTLAGVAVISAGCVSLPPVVHVEHKGDQQAVIRRLDAIDHRLNTLEGKSNEDMRRELEVLREEVERLRGQATGQQP
jgi:hypothetical protein